VVEARTAGGQIVRDRGAAPLPEPLAVVRREAGDDFPFHSLPRPLPEVEVRVYGDAIDWYLVEWAKERNPERYYGMVLPASLITSHTLTWESAANTSFYRPILKAPADSIVIEYHHRPASTLSTATTLWGCGISIPLHTQTTSSPTGP
jgi:hypothetical protein